jgi:uncharacterized protein
MLGVMVHPRPVDRDVRPGVPPVPLLVGGAVALIAWNAALNLVPFPPAAYVPANLALTGAALWAARRGGLSWEEVGLGRRQGRGLVLGLGVAAAVGLGLLLTRDAAVAAPLLDDARAAGLAGWALLYGAAIRIPFGTAVPEEVIFRGVLHGTLERRTGSWWRAAGWSSVVFGLWHIGPTIVLARVNGLDGSPWQVAGVVAGAVVATTAAGIGFSLLRRWGGGVLAPVLAHSATNGLGLLAAASAQQAGG